MKLTIRNDYNVDFITNILPKAILEEIQSRLLRYENKYLLKYIKDEFKISLKDLMTALKNNLIITTNAENIVIYFDNNRHIKAVKLETVISLLDFGNREIRGNNIVNSVLLYIKNNIDNLFNIYLMKGGKL